MISKNYDDKKETGFYSDHFFVIEQAVVLVPEFNKSKTVAKCIALKPAGVVQHRLIAGRCTPLRVLVNIRNQKYASMKEFW